MNSLSKMQERAREGFAQRFWKHRVPSKTEQAKDINDFLNSLIARTREEVLKEVEAGYENFEIKAERPDLAGIEAELVRNIWTKQFKPKLLTHLSSLREGEKEANL